MKMPWECPKCRAENGDGNVFCLHCGTYNGEAVDSASVDMRQDILTEVAAVLSERQDRHGQAEDSFGLIAAFWSAYLGVEVSKRDAALMMALFKIARGKIQPANRDNDRDAIGYMAIAADRTTATAADSQPLKGKGLADVLDGVTAIADAATWSSRFRKDAIVADKIRAYTPTCPTCGCITASSKCERCGHDMSSDIPAVCGDTGKKDGQR